MDALAFNQPCNTQERYGQILVTVGFTRLERYKITLGRGSNCSCFGTPKKWVTVEFDWGFGPPASSLVLTESTLAPVQNTMHIESCFSIHTMQIAQWFPAVQHGVYYH